MKFPFFKKNQIPQQPPTTSEKPLSNQQCLVDAFKLLNCDVAATDNEDLLTENAGLHAIYQGGSFFAKIMPDSAIVKILMPMIFEAESENFNELRFACNQMNNELRLVTCYYHTLDDDSAPDGNKTYVTAVGSLSIGEPKDLADNLSRIFAEFFDFRNRFAALFGDLLRRRGEAMPFDFEIADENLRRKRELVRNAELLHSYELHRMSGTAPDPSANLSLGDFLEAMSGIAVESVANLVAVGQDGLISEIDAANADDVRPLDLMVNRSWVVVKFRITESLDGRQPRSATLTVDDYGSQNRKRFYKVTLIVEGNDPMVGTSIDTPEFTPFSSSTIVAVGDGASDMAEYRYMLDDAREKIASGKSSDLTAEQNLLMRAMVSHTGYYLYHGTICFNAGRYVTALVYLKNAFSDMRPYFNKMDDKAREAFFEVCHMIGFIYNEFKVYEKAFYYLSLVTQANNSLMMREFINCLVNSGDPRAMGDIESLLADLEKFRQENPKGVTDEIVETHDFLIRRKIYLLIESGNFDDAETMLHEILKNHPDNEFAIKELAYIKRLRDML